MAVNNYNILKKVYSNIDTFRNEISRGHGFHPIDAEIRVDWKCNARCKMCGLHRYIDNSEYQRKSELSEENILTLLNDLSEMECMSVTFSGGEPTLRKDMGRIIRYAAKEKNMTVSINTNGNLLDKSKLDEYLDAGVDSFTFSILSPDPLISDNIMGLKNGLKHIGDAIDYINEYNCVSKARVKIFVNTVILRENIESFIGYKDFYNKHRIDHLNLSPASIFTEWDEWSSDNEKLRPTLYQVKAFKKNIIPKLQEDDWNLFVKDPFGDTDDEIEKNLHVIFSDAPRKCFTTMVHTVIQSNGDVIPCCYSDDNFIMGNVLKNSIKDIWNNEKYTRFRRMCRDLDWDMCKSCRQYQTINNKILQKIGGISNE
jgi:radical SAM protein with 4Fe4S-binding SPASM domain